MSSIFRLLSEDGKTVHDSISGDYEDSFTLDTFEFTCKAHIESEPKNTKGFIIARVQTLDPKQPDKVFYSYYNAFELNKILFQTQIYLKKRFIHRLHVLNPLTNSDIIGNVDYYLVRPPQTNEEVVVEIEATEPAPTAEVVGSGGSEAQKPKRVSVVFTQKPSGDTTKSDFSAIDIKKQKMDSIAGHAVAYEDEGQQRVVPTGMQIFQKKRRATVELSTVSTTYQSNKADRKRPSLTIITQMPTGQLPMGAREKVAATPGTVTRFNVPIPKEDLEKTVPKIQKGQRRSLSYANAVSATNAPVSFLQWAAMVKMDKKLLNSPSIQEEPIDYNLVSPLKITSVLRERMSPGGIKEEDEGVVDESEEKADDVDDMICYDAYYIANDTDFLQNSKTRKLFRDNACVPEDAKLFEMKEFTEKDAAERDQLEILEDDTFCEECYPTTTRLNEMGPCLRCFHMNKCIIFSLLIILGVVIFVVLMSFPNLWKDI